MTKKKKTTVKRSPSVSDALRDIQKALHNHSTCVDALNTRLTSFEEGCAAWMQKISEQIGDLIQEDHPKKEKDERSYVIVRQPQKGVRYPNKQKFKEFLAGWRIIESEQGIESFPIWTDNVEEASAYLGKDSCQEDIEVLERTDEEVETKLLSDYEEEQDEEDERMEVDDESRREILRSSQGPFIILFDPTVRDPDAKPGLEFLSKKSTLQKKVWTTDIAQAKEWSTWRQADAALTDLQEGQEVDERGQVGVKEDFEDEEINEDE
jgi:hypothetical protein